TQSHLTVEWSRVVSVPFEYDAPARVAFHPSTSEQEEAILDSIAECRRIRTDLDHRLGGATLDHARGEIVSIAQRWLAVADGRGEPFAAPAEVRDTAVIADGDHVIVNTGTGDDLVEIGV